MSQKVFLDHRLVEASEAVVSVFDHGFLYGDGIYETVHAYQSHVFHWNEHYRRLRHSARRIALRCPWSSAFLLRAVQKTLRANRQSDASVRITISRGPGSLGLSPKLCPRPTLALLLHPDRPVEKIRKNGVSIGLVDVRRNHPRCLDPQIKSNNSLNTILAKMEAERLGVFEGVLLNLEGHLTEGTISNLFFIRNGILHTPALSCGLLEGITRESVIHVARRAGWKVREGRYRPRDLRQAEEVFLSSTTLEIAPVVSVKQRLSLNRIQQWRIGNGRPGLQAVQLHRELRAYIQGELGLSVGLL